MIRPGEPPPVEPEQAPGETPGLPTSMWVRGLYLIAGFLLTGIGIVGAFLPLLPTTIFLILAAWCFGRSSPRFEAYLLNHARFGPPLRAWRRSGAIPRRAKRMAFAGMAAGYLIFLLSAAPRWPFALLVAAVMIASAVYVGTRPETT